MKIPPQAVAIAIALLALGHPTTSRAADPPAAAKPERIEVQAIHDPGLIQYRTIYKILSAFKKSDKYPRIDLGVHVASKNPEVTSRDISMQLVGKVDEWSVPISEDGMLDLPLKEQAFAENAEVVTNQPRQSLRAQFRFTYRLPPAKRYSYRELWELNREAERAVEEFVPPLMRWLVPAFTGFEFAFEDRLQFRAEVVAGKFVRRLVVEPSGRVFIPLRRDWYEQDATIEFSALPLRVGST